MRSGDTCIECGVGIMRVQNTLPLAKYRRQYLRCNAGCGATGKCTFVVDERGRRVVDSDREELLAIIASQKRTMASQEETIARLTVAMESLKHF
tara:strand:- start:125 stop:406 length:282 start_codon:yes stop_codon:yes gene_type:complete